MLLELLEMLRQKSLERYGGHRDRIPNQHKLWLCCSERAEAKTWGPALQSVVVLEVGGGDGRLSHYLREALAAKNKIRKEGAPDSNPGPDFSIVCTDSGLDQLHLQSTFR